MGKKSAHTGESPKDRSINIMDKFISRNTAKSKHQPVLPARRKDPNIPIYMWPLKDQLEYWDSRTENEEFQSTYKTYATWYEDVKSKSKLYPATFISMTHDKKDIMRDMYVNCMWPKEAVRELQKHGVY